MITILDYVLSPVFLVILIALAKRYRDKHYPPGHPLHKLYMWGLYAKFFGAVFIAVVFQYYYGWGDTFNFMQHAQIINSSFTDSPATWLRLVTHTAQMNNPAEYKYISSLYWWVDVPSYSVGAIAAVLGLFTGTTYLPTALLFAFFAYTGTWAMFTTFVRMYPERYKGLAIAFLFIPSTVVWGSAIFKDTICMFGLGWMVHTTFRIFVERDFSVKNLVLLVLSFYLVAVIKLYILMAFLPALAFWLLLNYSKKIRSAALRWTMNLVFLGLVAGGVAFLLQKFSAELDKYNLENIQDTIDATRFWTNYAAGDQGSVYDIGKLDGTLGGTVALFPKAVNVTLFRPYVWEVRKVIELLAALESFVFLLITIRVLFDFKNKPFKKMFRDPNIIFCLIFAIIFAFAVGISSGNFGVLSRYKIPCLPFYAGFLILMYPYKKPVISSSRQRQAVLLQTA